MTSDELAAQAMALVGAPFRLHGRDPATGLDCLGVLAAALAACGISAHLPNGYLLRQRVLPEMDEYLVRNGLITVTGPVVPGDVILVRTGPYQLHLLIAADSENFVHAHVGLRRVICGGLPTDWPVLRHWRISSENKD
jgi:cell wall-associated NlpC family hydrolase